MQNIEFLQLDKNIRQNSFVFTVEGLSHIATLTDNSNMSNYRNLMTHDTTRVEPLEWRPSQLSLFIISTLQINTAAIHKCLLFESNGAYGPCAGLSLRLYSNAQAEDKLLCLKLTGAETFENDTCACHMRIGVVEIREEQKGNYFIHLSTL